MGLRKHGEGEVLPSEDVSKTASTDNPEDRQERLAALQQENEENDG